MYIQTPYMQLALSVSIFKNTGSVCCFRVFLRTLCKDLFGPSHTESVIQKHLSYSPGVVHERRARYKEELLYHILNISETAQGITMWKGGRLELACDCPLTGRHALLCGKRVVKCDNMSRRSVASDTSHTADCT